MCQENSKRMFYTFKKYFMTSQSSIMISFSVRNQFDIAACQVINHDQNVSSWFVIIWSN